MDAEIHPRAESTAWRPPLDLDDEPEIIDLTELARSGHGGTAWREQSDDLAATLTVLDRGVGLSAHIDYERDLLLVGVMGEGAVTIDGRISFLWPGAALLIPKGTRRSIQPSTGRFAYLACVRRSI
jgi:mannose-6-phosphate isomerase-like protein (cupin superfamily)